MGTGREAGSSQVEGLEKRADRGSFRWQKERLMVRSGDSVGNVKSRRAF